MEKLHIDLGHLVDNIKYYQEIAKLKLGDNSSQKWLTRIGVSKNFVLERTNIHDPSIPLKEESEGKGYDIRPMQLSEIDDFHKHECRLSEQLNVAVRIAKDAGYSVDCKYNFNEGQAILMGDPSLLELLETLKLIDDKMTSNSIPCSLLKPWQHLSIETKARESKRIAEMGFSRRNKTHFSTSKFQQPLVQNSTSNDVRKSKIGWYQIYEKFVSVQGSRFLTAQQSIFFDEIIDSISNAHSNDDLSEIKEAFQIFENDFSRNLCPKILEIKQKLNEKIYELSKSGVCKEPLELPCTTKVLQKQNLEATSISVKKPMSEHESSSRLSLTLPSSIKAASIETTPQSITLSTAKMSIYPKTVDNIDVADSEPLHKQLEHILVSIYQYSSTEDYQKNREKLLKLIGDSQTASALNLIKKALVNELKTARASRLSVMNSVLNGAIQYCEKSLKKLNEEEEKLEVTKLKSHTMDSQIGSVATEITPAETTSAVIIVTELVKCVQNLSNQIDENEQVKYQDYMWNLLDQFGATVRESESLSITYELANVIQRLHNHKFNCGNNIILRSTKEVITDYVESLIRERIDTQIKEAQQELSVVVVRVAHLVQTGRYTLQNKKEIQLDLSDFEKRAGRDAQLFNEVLTWLKNASDQPISDDHFKCVLTCVDLDQVTFTQQVQKLESQDLAMQYSQAAHVDEQKLALPEPIPIPIPKTEINADVICFNFDTFILSQPLAMGQSLVTDKSHKDILAIRKQHHCFDTGSPVRCISSKEFGYFSDVQKLEKGQRWLSLSFWLGKRSHGEEYRRPVTYLFENAPIRLYLSNEVVLLLDPVMLKPWAIFKSNAFTVRILDAQSELEKEVMLNQRNYRGYQFPIGRKGVKSSAPKRLVDISTLGQKMAERIEWRSSMDQNPTSSGHLLLNETEATLDKSQRKRFNSRVEYSKETFPHNEVICQPIYPAAIQATTHYLSPDCFQGNHSIYFRLGMRLEQHIALFKLIKNDTQRKRLLFVVYLAERGALLEVGELNSMLPNKLLDECVKNKNASEVIGGLDNQMSLVCSRLGVNHQALQRMLMFSPLLNQLSWLERQNLFCRNKDEWLEELWKCVFATPVNIIEPQKISETIQQIVQYLYHCPISVIEMSHCLEQNKTPQDLNCRPSSSEAFASAFCCQWMCQLLETEGVCFSEQEKLILIYSMLIERTKLPKTKVVEIIEQLFGSVFDEGVLNTIKQALLNLNKIEPLRNVRADLYRVIIQFSIDFIESLVNEKSTFNENTIKSSKVVKKYLFTGSTSPKFKSNLKSAMNGMIDVMIVNGLIKAEDQRTQTLPPQVRFGLRVDITNSSENRIEILKNRKAKLDNHANISRGFTEQIKDQCKRELFLLAGVEVPNTMRLRQQKLPDSMMMLDMLSINNETQRESNREIVDHLSRNIWPLPIFHITKEQHDKIMREPRLKMARETEIQKKIPDRVLNSYRSPTTIAAVNAIHRRNEFLAIQTQDRIKVDAS